MSRLFQAQRIALLAILFFISICLQAQHIRFEHLSIKQGLSQGNVWDIHQDHLGFMWIATEDGLNLYNGYTFTVFRNNPTDSLSISNNNIDSFVEDNAGNLWIATQEGLNYYNRSRNQFKRFYHNPNDLGSLSSNDIGCVFIDSKNTIWVGTTYGLNFYDSTTRKFVRFFHDPQNATSLANNIIECIEEDRNGRLWIGTGGGLSMLDKDRKTFKNFYHVPEDNTTLSSNKITALFEDHQEVLWVGTLDKGLNKKDPFKNNFQRYVNDPADPKTIGNNYVCKIEESKNGELWVATDGSLNLLNQYNGTFTRHTQILGDETSLSSSIVVELFFDINDRMWVGTRFGGINIYDRDKYGFQHFKFSSYNKDGLNNNNITDFIEDIHGNVYIGTDGGSINYYDRKTGKFTNYLNLFTNNKVLALAKDETEGLWVGMWEGGLNYYDAHTKKVKHYITEFGNPKSLSDNNVFDIIIDRTGTVWIGTWGNGLNKYNPETDDFTRYEHDPKNNKTFAGSSIAFLLEDSYGFIWIATEEEGLDRFDPTTETFTHYKAGTTAGQLSGNSVSALLEDSKHRLWVGTTGAGLNVFDRKQETFKTYRQSDGLPNDAIMGILEDAEGNIWVSTNKGLSRFNVAQKSFRNFSESDGLQSDQFNTWSCAKLSTGELLFGGTNGFNLFDPKAIKENNYAPPVYITDFKLFNKSITVGEHEALSENIILTKKIKLNYFENNFSFEFAALNYRNPEKNKYKYKMEGFETDWIEAGTERRVSYTNLNPGEYNFIVMASNNDGIWSDEIKSISIIIVPPFWKTWWFNSMFVLLIASAIVGYVRYQRKKIQRQHDTFNSIINERTRELTSQNEEMVKQAEQEKTHLWITQGLALISDTISKNNNDLNALTNELLRSVVNYTDAQQGVLALAMKEDPSDEHLKIYATYGISKKQTPNERIEIGSGILGETYRDKEKKILEHLPDGYIKIQSGLGEALPTKVIVQPLKTEDGEMVGVMELAFLNEISTVATTFLDKVSGLISLNIVTVTLTHKTMILLEQSKEQTEEMRAQEEEMRQNMEELEATQEEFKRREGEYLKEIEECRQRERLLLKKVEEFESAKK
jgi:ligand-binding sensor domain-containing protein